MIVAVEKYRNQFEWRSNIESNNKYVIDDAYAYLLHQVLHDFRVAIFSCCAQCGVAIGGHARIRRNVIQFDQARYLKNIDLAIKRLPITNC